MFRIEKVEELKKEIMNEYYKSFMMMALLFKSHASVNEMVKSQYDVLIERKPQRLEPISGAKEIFEGDIKVCESAFKELRMTIEIIEKKEAADNGKNK